MDRCAFKGLDNVDHICRPTQQYDLLDVPLVYNIDLDPGEDYALNATDPDPLVRSEYKEVRHLSKNRHVASMGRAVPLCVRSEYKDVRHLSKNRHIASMGRAAPLCVRSECKDVRRANQYAQHCEPLVLNGQSYIFDVAGACLEKALAAATAVAERHGNRFEWYEGGQ